MFKKIFFPTDDSIHSKRALEYVKEIALMYKSEVIVFHSYTLPLLYTIVQEEKLKEMEMEILKKYEQELTDAGITYKPLLLHGHPGKLITELVEINDCDLIIMGSRGLSEIKGILLGSTSNFVVHQTKCPVFLV